MSQKVVACCKCKKLFSFNTRYLQRQKFAEVKRGETKSFTVTCLHCGAENKVELEI